MKLHGNAALTPNGRSRLARRVVEDGWSLSEAAEAAEVSERTARKWVVRYRGEGEAGLVDRSSLPKTQPGATPEDRVEAIAALRRVRLTGQEIAEALGMALSTVQGILTRIGLGKAVQAGAAGAAQPLRAQAARRRPAASRADKTDIEPPPYGQQIRALPYQAGEAGGYRFRSGTERQTEDPKPLSRPPNVVRGESPPRAA